MLMTSTVGAEQQLQGMLEDPAPYLVIEREYFCQSPRSHQHRAFMIDVSEKSKQIHRGVTLPTRCAG